MIDSLSPTEKSFDEGYYLIFQYDYFDQFLYLLLDDVDGALLSYVTPKNPCKQLHIVNKWLVNFPIVVWLIDDFYLLNSN